MFRATGPGRVDVIFENKSANILEALLFNFDFDDFDDRKFRKIKTEHHNFLETRVVPLLEKGKGNIWIQGSASKVGTSEWNMITSMVRAGQVRAYLLDRNIDPTQIVADAIGNKVALGHANDDARDRSVVIWVYPNVTAAKPLPKQVPPRPHIGPNKVKKVYIYDQTSEIDRRQASGRFDADEVLTIPISGGITELRKQFDALLASGQTFNRVLFQTHGGPGRIWFGSEALNKVTLKTHFAGYTGLFPTATRIFFDGCNVAEGGDGTDFLLAAGYVFLKIGGGETFGWVNVGHGLSGWVPFFGGHTIHFGGGNNLKRIRFFTGGEPNFAGSWIPAR